MASYGEGTLSFVEELGSDRNVKRKNTWEKRLGLRCARNDKPRLTIAEFGKAT